VAEKMLLPFFKDGTFGKFFTSIGLWIYDFLAGVRKEDRRRMLSRRQTLELEPLLPPATLIGSGLYAEYRTDDARLTMEIIKTSIDQGADCINYMTVLDFIYEDEKITGIMTRDNLTGIESNIAAKVVVSAAGPWVDEIRGINRSHEGKTLHLTKGVHIVVPHEKLPVRHSVYFDVADGRMIFAIPRDHITYIGTTDTDYFGSKESVNTSLQDAAYLIGAVNRAFPSVDLKIGDVISSWAGLRPLINQPGKKTSEISRKDEVFISDSGLISIAGGKLTGYRKMSLKIVNRVARILRSDFNIPSGKCMTRKLRLSGNHFNGSREVAAFTGRIAARLNELKIDPGDAQYLVHNYGSQAEEIVSLAGLQNGNSSEEKLIMAEVEFCIRNEMVVSAADFWIRRTGRLYFRINSLKNFSEPVLAKMSAVFNWTPSRLNEERNRIDNEIFHATHFE
jgi:glycerol-3-phosphate dehydrogenase